MSEYKIIDDKAHTKFNQIVNRFNEVEKVNGLLNIIKEEGIRFSYHAITHQYKSKFPSDLKVQTVLEDGVLGYLTDTVVHDDDTLFREYHILHHQSRYIIEFSICTGQEEKEK